MPGENDSNAAGALPEALALLAENERALKSLYEEYARQLPAQNGFWLGMAAEEARHAEWIEDLGDAPQLGSSIRARFTIESILTFTDYVNEQQAFAGQGTTTAAALSTAYYIETALIERRFFEQLPQRSPEVARVLASLRRETEQHVRKVKDALSRTVAQ